MKQHVRFGHNALLSLPDILKSLNVTSIALFCGVRSFEDSGAASHIARVQDRFHIETFRVGGPLPSLSGVAPLLEQFGRHTFDAVLAVGGGHIIDTAKLVNVIAADRDRFIAGGIAAFTPVTAGKPMIAVPTTAGSGSEATHFAVVYDGNTKYSIAAPFMVPEVAVIDPTLLMSASATVRSASGADALCQAIESLWSAGATADSMFFAGEAISLMMPNLQRWIQSPDPASAAAAAKSAFLAGKAINISKTTAPHALSYHLTAEYGIPHGHAVSVFVPAFLEFNAAAGPADLSNGLTYSDFLAAQGVLLDRLGVKEPKDAARRLRELFDAIHLHTDLTSFGVTADDSTERIADSVNTERLNNNPRRVSRNDLLSIIRSVIR